VSAGDPHAGHGSHPPGAPSGSAAPPTGYAPFTLSADKARAVALQTAPVQHRQFTRELRTVGAVVLDETRTSHVHSKVRGWIESVSANFVGKRVRRGAPLCTIYSQEVYAAELEFLSVLEQSTSRLPLKGEFGDAERRAQSQLLSAARRRLQLWDVPKSEIERLERTREPRRTFTLTAPRGGVILAKQALAGMFIEPTLELYVISDVEKLWVLADIYDTDVPFVKVGEAANLTFDGASEPRKATVAFLPPTIDERTRTLKVRFEVDNKDGRLRPGAFATVEMKLPMGHSLAIPENAVIHAGPRNLAFVVDGERIEPREIMLGPLVGGFYRLERGLTEHDRVAVNAQFLIDSESRLRATQSPGGGHVGH
jgi:membrane fusion protein, copper/silver efflux system